MTRTFCDLCKQEIAEGYADKEIHLAHFDHRSLQNLSAVVKIGIQGSSETDLCKECAFRVIREGTEIPSGNV